MDNPHKKDYESSKVASSVDHSQHLKKLHDYFGKYLVSSGTWTPKLKLNANIVHQGWMFKRKSVLSNWSERWFCLCQDFTLRMISNDGLERAVMDLSTMINPATYYWSESANMGTIRLECVGRTWNFMIPDEDSFKVWRNRLNHESKFSRNRAPNIAWSGWLWKRGLVNKGWKKRYCRLQNNGMFSYSKSESNGKPQGNFFLNNSTELKTDGNENRYFSVEQTERTWFFKASSKSEAQQWCKAIRPFVKSSETRSTDRHRVFINQKKSKLSISLVGKSFESKLHSSPRPIDSKNPKKALILKSDYFGNTPLSQKTKNLNLLLTPSQKEVDFPNSRDAPSVATGINTSFKNSISLRPAKVDKAHKTGTQESISLECESINNNPDDIKTFKLPDLWTGPTKLNSNVPSLFKDGSSITKVCLSNQNQILCRSEEKFDTLGLSLTEKTEHVSSEAPSITYKTDISQISLRRKAEWTYEDVLASLFYRFAGVSPYSDTNLRMSTADLEILLTCLHLEKHCENLSSRMESDGSGLISIGEFVSACSEMDIRTLITNTYEYEFLVVTLMTMKEIDPTQSKRISRDDFYSLVDTFFDDDDAEQIFLKYDTDGVGQLHVANLFLFLHDYFDLENEEEEEDEKFDASQVSQT